MEKIAKEIAKGKIPQNTLYSTIEAQKEIIDRLLHTNNRIKHINNILSGDTIEEEINKEIEPKVGLVDVLNKLNIKSFSILDDMNNYINNIESYIG